MNPIEIKVRFADVDMMGHVNNAVYLNYFETARMEFFEQLLGENWNWQENGIILLRNEVDYIKPLLLNDKPVIIIDVRHLGNKSFTLGYELIANNQVYCKGVSILVAYDYSNEASISIPKQMKDKLFALKEE